MDRKIIYLVNPVSGTRGKTSLPDLLTRKSRERSIEFELMTSDAQGHYDALRDKLRQERITDLVICGGDGTVNSVLASLGPPSINVGIIPLGSGNGLAFAAGIPRHPAAALEVIFKGHAALVDAFTVNGRFACMLCGIGFDALVAHEFAKQKSRGLQTYIRISARHFFKATPYPFDIQLPEKKIHTEAFFISIANSNQFGNNFTIAPQASLADGLLDIVIVKKMSKLKLPFSVITQVAGLNAMQKARDYKPGKDIIYLQTDRLDISNPAGAPVHIDGEPAGVASEFSVRMLKSHFRLLQPPKK